MKIAKRCEGETMKGYPNSDPSKKDWSHPWRFDGYPEYVPVYCTRCGDYMYDQEFGAGMSGKMCDDCKAISKLFSQRKYRAQYGFFGKDGSE